MIINAMCEFIIISVFENYQYLIMDHGFGGLPFLFSIIEPTNASLLSMWEGSYEAMTKFPWFSHQNTEIQTILHKMKNKVLVDRIDNGGNTGKEKTNLDCSL